MVFQLKRIKLFMEHFFFAKATCEPSPGSKCFLNSKAHTRLVFPCTMHNSPLSRRQYFPSVSFPLPCFNRPLGVGSLSPQPGSQSCLKSTCKPFGSQADHFEVKYPEIPCSSNSNVVSMKSKPQKRLWASPFNFAKIVAHNLQLCMELISWGCQAKILDRSWREFAKKT